MKIAIITSRFNQPVTSKLLEGALARAQECNIARDDIKVVEVPGAVEIPLVAKLLAKQQRYDAIIALGAVIRGETSHYDYVCDQVSQGCQQVMMEFELPVIFGILTTENAAQALARAGGEHSHKGRDAIDAVLEMVQICQSL